MTPIKKDRGRSDLDALKKAGYDVTDLDNIKPKPDGPRRPGAVLRSNPPSALYGIDPSIVSAGVAYVRFDRPLVQTWRIRPDCSPWGKPIHDRPNLAHEWTADRLRRLYRRVFRILCGADDPSGKIPTSVGTPIRDAVRVIVEDTYFAKNSGREAVCLLGKAHAACLSAAEAVTFPSPPVALKADRSSELLVPDETRKRIRAQFDGDELRREVKLARWMYAREAYAVFVGPSCPYLEELTQVDERDAFALAVAHALEVVQGNS